MNKPVFVLSGGARTGSTLVQRLLMSSGQLCIWGEHGGIVADNLYQLLQGMRAWITREGHEQLWRLKSIGYEAWVPNVTPPADAFLEGVRACFSCAFDEPAKAMGYSRWGFKEIRYGRTAALFLQEVFGDACFVLPIRHPAACLRSIKATGWYQKDYNSDPFLFLHKWATLTAELVDTLPDLHTGHVVRYEELCTEPAMYVNQLERVVNISPGLIDVNVLNVRVRGASIPSNELSPREREAIQSPFIRRVAQRMNYDYDETV